MSHITNQRPLHTSSIAIYLSHSIYQNTPHYIRINHMEWLEFAICYQLLSIQNINDQFHSFYILRIQFRM